MKTGYVELKKKFLGAPYPGQDLCYCMIDIAPDAVAISVRREGVETRSTLVTNEDDVRTLRAKLRGRVMGKRVFSRWVLIRTRSYVRLIIYYPSLSWGAKWTTVAPLVQGTL